MLNFKIQACDSLPCPTPSDVHARKCRAVVPNIFWCIPSFAHLGNFHSSPMEISFPPCSAAWDPDQAFGGSIQIGAPKSLHLHKYQRLSATIVGCHTNVVTFCRPKKWLFVLFELCYFSGNNHSLKALCIINSENVWNGPQTVGLIFHKLRISCISTKCI